MPINSSVSGWLNAREIALYESSVLKRLASLASFEGEWASELDTRVNRSRADILQFIGGSEDKPVSREWLYGVMSSKHSSMLSKPEYAPNSEKCGVQIWAGINTASGQVSSVISKRSRLSKPSMGPVSYTHLDVYKRQF